MMPVVDLQRYFVELQTHLTEHEGQIAQRLLQEINSRLQFLVDVGLGYLTLNRASNSLAGGESQRIKLAAALSKRDTGKTLYILDEPTTGLHFEDVKVLFGVLNRLVGRGNTGIVIEHNLDVLKCADWIIDLGPEAGRNGGKIIATGTPEEVAKSKKSTTAPFLKSALKPRHQ